MNKQTRKRAHHRAAGISMVESLVALVVISVGMLGIAGLYMASLQAGRSANLRVQAVNLASDMGDRIRANRDGLAAYNMAVGGTGVAHICTTPTACTAAFIAENDLFVWSNAVKAALPAGATAAVTYLDKPNGEPDLFTIAVNWREAGSDVDASYVTAVQVIQ